ncbi:60S ribosomal L13-like protein [Medicago truncatula]|uniref:60S ribosomal L13-like protein n=1 Tax=Medicago truncatula TaxID=3880 RepID=G7L741_MEDTR|nr:60S ribosomal L13-like protein [Medicago truncatula]
MFLLKCVSKLMLKSGKIVARLQEERGTMQEERDTIQEKHDTMQTDKWIGEINLSLQIMPSWTELNQQSLEDVDAFKQEDEGVNMTGKTFQKNGVKRRAGDSSPEERANATQVQGTYLPIVREKPSVELVKVTDEMKAFKAYYKLRLECQIKESR